MDILEACVQDSVTAVLWQQAEKQSLVFSEKERILKGKVIASGSLVLRYAIPFQGPQHLSLVPATFLSEQGISLEGRRAWRFITKNYQLYPRAEVFGLQSDGEEIQAFLRELDFADQPRVLAYAAVDKTLPLAQVTHLIADNTSVIPELLQSILPVEIMED